MESDQPSHSQFPTVSIEDRRLPEECARVRIRESATGRLMTETRSCASMLQLGGIIEFFKAGTTRRARTYQPTCPGRARRKMKIGLCRYAVPPLSACGPVIWDSLSSCRNSLGVSEGGVKGGNSLAGNRLPCKAFFQELGIVWRDRSLIPANQTTKSPRHEEAMLERLV
jgi:hypothetical protein